MSKNIVVLKLNRGACLTLYHMLANGGWHEGNAFDIMNGAGIQRILRHRAPGVEKNNAEKGMEDWLNASTNGPIKLTEEMKESAFKCLKYSVAKGAIGSTPWTELLLSEIGVASPVNVDALLTDE